MSASWNSPLSEDSSCTTVRHKTKKCAREPRTNQEQFAPSSAAPCALGPQARPRASDGGQDPSGPCSKPRKSGLGALLVPLKTQEAPPARAQRTQRRRTQLRPCESHVGPVFLFARRAPPPEKAAARLPTTKKSHALGKHAQCRRISRAGRACVPVAARGAFRFEHKRQREPAHTREIRIRTPQRAG